MYQIYINSFLNAFILNQRKVNSLIRKDIGINRTHVEVLTYAANTITFTVHQVQSQFRHTNIQIVRRSIKRLIELKLLEGVGTSKQKAMVYMLTREGRKRFDEYVQQWTIALNQSSNQ